MANPQTEDGYTKIANELIDNALSKINLSSYETRILWVILRKTYGWGKIEDSISVTQFEKLTGMKRRHVQRTLDGLIARNIIIKKEGYVNSFSFNKNYETWDHSPLGKHETITNRGYTQTITNRGYGGVTKGGYKTITNGGYHKRKKKLYKRKDAEEVYLEYPRKADKNNSIKSIQKLLESGESKESLLRAVNNYKKRIEAKGTETDFIIQSNNFFGRAARWKEFVDLPEQKGMSQVERAMQRCKERGDY